MRHHEAVADLPAVRTLADIVTGLDRLHPAAHNGGAPTIFAEMPWTPSSAAVVLNEGVHRGRAASMPSYAYLLEVGHAAEVLEVWSSRRSGMVPSPEQAVDALIHYAAHEVHQPMTCVQYGCGRPGAGSCATCQRTICTRHAEGSVPDLVCPTCSRGTAPQRTGTPKPGVGGRRRLHRALLVVGAASIGLGLLTSTLALSVAGTCVLVVGACTWLGAFVLRLMD